MSHFWLAPPEPLTVSTRVNLGPPGPTPSLKNTRNLNQMINRKIVKFIIFMMSIKQLLQIIFSNNIENVHRLIM